MSNTVVFCSADEIELMVRRFESCDFAKGEFTHALHLAVAAWYSFKYSDEEALTRMRSGLLRLTNKFGVKAYHETITQFWMRMSRDFLASERSGSSLAAAVNRFVQQLHFLAKPGPDEDEREIVVAETKEEEKSERVEGDEAERFGLGKGKIIVVPRPPEAIPEGGR